MHRLARLHRFCGIFLLAFFLRLSHSWAFFVALKLGAGIGIPHRAGSEFVGLSLPNRTLLMRPTRPIAPPPTAEYGPAADVDLNMDVMFFHEGEPLPDYPRGGVIESVKDEDWEGVPRARS